jgi:flap endonuclease-1
MGVPLTPIIVKHTLALEDLRGRRLAVDGNGELYQFLALIRQRDGTPLMTSDGRITSHLVGLFYRTTRLISDYGLDLVFVFDGAPPALKRGEIARRRDVRQRYEAEHAQARAEGDLARAYSKATMTSRLTADMVAEAQRLLELLGIPVIRAPGEGEAQAAHLAARGDAWAAATKDYDSLLFGTPRLLRFLTISGKEFLPSKGVSRPITPELIVLDEMLAAYRISREQLVDLAILVGTDFNAGVKGIGPKKALKLVQDHGRIDAMPEAIREAVDGYEAVREVFLRPRVSDDYALASGAPDEDGVLRFLSDEREFSKERVTAALQRLKNRDRPRF